MRSDLGDKVLFYLQWPIVLVAVVVPLTQYFFDWPLKEFGIWAYLFFALIAVCGIFIHAVVSISGFVIAFIGVGISVLAIILDLTAYFFPNFISAGKLMGYELSPGYRFIGGVLAAIVLGGTSFLLGGFLVSIGKEKDEWIWKARESPFLLKMGATLSSIFCISLLSIHLYISRLAIWEVLSSVLIYVVIAIMLYLVYRISARLDGQTLLAMNRCPNCNTPLSHSSDQNSLSCNSCNGSWQTF